MKNISVIMVATVIFVCVLGLGFFSATTTVKASDDPIIVEAVCSKPYVYGTWKITNLKNEVVIVNYQLYHESDPSWEYRGPILIPAGEERIISLPHQRGRRSFLEVSSSLLAAPIVVPASDVICEESAPCNLDGWVDMPRRGSFLVGLRKNGTPVLPERIDQLSVIGAPTWSPGKATGFLSLGFGGSIIYNFDGAVKDVEGFDLSIHEATNGNRFSYKEETAKVEVSQDGVVWYELPGSVSSWAAGGVTRFDIGLVGLTRIRHVRVIDTTDWDSAKPTDDGIDIVAIGATLEEGQCQ